MTDCKCEDWKAYHDHLPPGPATLRVTATCSCPPGRTLELRRKEVQGINERDLLLELTEVEQDGDGELEYREAESSLVCPACRLRYPVRDDIPIMLLDEATPLEPR